MMIFILNPLAFLKKIRLNGLIKLTNKNARTAQNRVSLSAFLNKNCRCADVKMNGGGVFAYVCTVLRVIPSSNFNRNIPSYSVSKVGLSNCNKNTKTAACQSLAGLDFGTCPDSCLMSLCCKEFCLWSSLSSPGKLSWMVLIVYLDCSTVLRLKTLLPDISNSVSTEYACPCPKTAAFWSMGSCCRFSNIFYSPVTKKIASKTHPLCCSCCPALR